MVRLKHLQQQVWQAAAFPMISEEGREGQVGITWRVASKRLAGLSA